jgi:hypothetical protein
VTVPDTPQNTPRLSEREARDLRCLAGMMIPASAEYGVPGADDAAIFDTILNSLGRDLGHASAVLHGLARLSGGAFADLEPTRRDAVVASLRAAGGEDLAILHRVVLLCYYRDDRVMTSLGLELRSPFPKGHQLEQGDWTLLDPVRKRPKLWRDAS